MEGPQFLKKRFNTHNTPEAKQAAKRTELRTGEKVPQSPQEQIQNYLNRFKEISEREDGSPEKERGLEALKKIFHDEHVIKEANIPDSYFVLQQQIAREQGHGDIEITEEMRREAVDVIQADQKESLNLWIEYFASTDAGYPDWGKYWAFRSMLQMSSYDKDKQQFGKRSKQTTAPFPDLDREAVGYAINFLEKRVAGETIKNPTEDLENPFTEEEKLVSDEEFQHLLTTENFAKYYAFAIEHIITDSSELHKNIEGEWVKYNQGTPGSELAQTLQGHGTGWCTAGESTAHNQLQAGDFYVYYSQNKLGENKIPRLAIRMEHNEIAEVRGIAPEQNVDEFITPVLSKKMNEFGERGKMYKKRSEDMARLTEIDEKFKNQKGLTREDLRFLYEIDGEIEGFGYDTDPRIMGIKGWRSWKADMVRIFETENDNQLAYKLIDMGQLDAMVDNLQSFKGLSGNIAHIIIDGHREKGILGNLEVFEDLDHSEIVQKILDAGEDRIIAVHLENLKDLDPEIAFRLIGSGYGDNVVHYLDNFVGLDRTKVAHILIDHTDEFDSVARNLEKFEGIDHVEIAERLIDKGGGVALADHFDKFQGLDHVDIANRLLDSGDGPFLARNLNRFDGLDHVDIANRLIASGNEHCLKELAGNLNKFRGVDPVNLAYTLIEAGELDSLGYNLWQFKELTTEIALTLLDSKWGENLLANLGLFSGINHQVIANQLIQRGEADELFRYFKHFSNLDESEIVDRLFKTDQSWAVARNLDSFTNLNHTDIANRLIDAGEVLELNGSIDLFSNLTPRVANRLIDAKKGLAVAHYMNVSFKGLDRIDIAQRLIASGQMGVVVSHLDKFDGLDHTKIARQVIELGFANSFVVREHIDKFKDVPKDIMDQLT